VLGKSKARTGEPIKPEVQEERNGDREVDQNVCTLPWRGSAVIGVLAL